MATNAATNTPSKAPAATTWQYQEQLPRLPVPELRDTLAKYTASVQPFLSASERAATQRAVDEFAAAGGWGERLQTALRRKARDARTHWLEEWWDTQQYFGPREPIALLVNFHFVFDSLRAHERTQTRRAAELVHAAATFKRALDTWTLEPTLQRGKTPECMVAYKYMFNTCRVPHERLDTIHTQYADAQQRRFAPTDTARHIVVVRKGRFFALDIVDDSGEICPVHLLDHVLAAIVERVDRASTRPPALAALTGGDRDEWARVRDSLLAGAAGTTNRAALETLETSICHVCLDDFAPQSLDDANRSLWHGDGFNRWFDKSVSLVVWADGTAGLNGEHSKLDGLPVLRLTNYMLAFDHTPRAGRHIERPFALRDAREVTFDYESTAAVRECAAVRIPRALASFLRFADEFESRVVVFTEFGKRAITRHRMSPDAFAQLAMHLAYYRLVGSLPPTYESGVTKTFYHGRTETIRTTSTASVAFLAAMCDTRADATRRFTALRTAAAAHSKYSNDANSGRGIDRHLLGLRKLYEHEFAGRDGAPTTLPSLFTDVAFARSGGTGAWLMSTSQLGSESFFAGFGPVADDGFGVCYVCRQQSLVFNVASWRKCPTTSVRKYEAELRRALADMMSTCVDAANAGAANAAAKL